MRNGSALISPPATLVLTRPRVQAQELASQLDGLGYDVELFPLLEIVALTPGTALHQTLLATLTDLRRFALAAFVSPNAVHAVFADGLVWPPEVAIAVMGEGSRKALASYGIDDSNTRIFSPSDAFRADSETLLENLNLVGLQGQEVVIFRAETGRELLSEALLAQQIRVEKVVAYHRVMPALSEGNRQQLLRLLDQPACWIVSSSEALRTLESLALQSGGEAAVVKTHQINLWVSHYRIAQTARKSGFSQVQLIGSGDQNLLRALQSGMMPESVPPAKTGPAQDPSAQAILITSAKLEQTVESTPSRHFLKSPNLIYLLLLLLAALLLGQWWSSTSQISQLREELARRLQTVDASNAETRVIVKTMQESSKELQVKIGVLDNKQTDSESHALALQQLYQDLSKNRDDWALSEIEQVLSTASQQLQLAGNVTGALIALQNADARLARSDKPQFITIRRSIARDIDRLKALPNVDLPGIALRLDSAIAQIETMPLWVDENQVPLVNPVKTRASTKAPKSGPAGKNSVRVAEESVQSSWLQWADDRWQSWSTEMWDQMQLLVRIRNVDNPDALLLTPSQGYFARENVKLRLLNARLALLSRSETPFRSDMIAAQNEISRYFDTRSKQTQTVQALLRQIQNSNVSIEMPSLAESLNAVRNFTVKQ